MLKDKLLAIDPIIIAIYLVLSLVLGLFGSKLIGMKSNNEEDFYLAGRKMPGWLNGISLAATSLNSDVAPLYCGIAIAAGLSSGWFFLSRFGLLFLFGSILFAVKWRQLKVKTGPEFWHLRFGRGRDFARVYASVTSVLIGMIPWIGAGLIGIHLVAAPIFGIESKAVTLLIILPLLMVYVWSSGLAGVLITDAMQSFVILFANIIMVVAVLFAFGGPTGLYDSIVATNGENSNAILSLMPVNGNAMCSPLTVFAWLLLTGIGAGGGVGSDGQRLFSCKSNYEAAKVGIWGELTLFIMLLMIMLPTLGLLAKNPDLYYGTTQEREMAYGMMLQEFLPKGGVGITVAALLAAVMSTISTHLNYGSQTLMNDVWRPLIGEIEKGKEVWIGRLMMVIIVALSVIVVFVSGSLLEIAITVVGLFGASASFGWGQWWYYRVNFKSWCASVLSGPIVYLICGKLLPLIPWWKAQQAISEASSQNMLILQAVVALVINTFIWLVVTWSTKPEDMEILKEFYMRARPMGYWKPVRDALIAEGRIPAVDRKPKLLKGIGIVFVGFVMISSLILLLSTLYVGLYTQGAIIFAILLGSGMLFKFKFKNYINSLEDDI